MNLTKHIKERYVERTMGYTDEQEIARYITLNEDIITERIIKLFESSEKIYRGKMKDHESCDVYINKNGWVFIVDYKKECIVTLYRVDLKVDDEELNRTFCEKMLTKINEYKQEYETAALESLSQAETNQKQINEIDDKLKLYNTYISALQDERKNLIEQNKIYQKKVTVTESVFKSIIEEFICKRAF